MIFKNGSSISAQTIKPYSTIVNSDQGFKDYMNHIKVSNLQKTETLIKKNFSTKDTLGFKDV